MNSYSSQKCSSGAPEGAPETALETMYFMLFFKKLARNLEKKLVIKFFFDGIGQLCNYFFFLHPTSFIIGENSPAMDGWKINCVYEAPSLSFFR